MPNDLDSKPSVVSEAPPAIHADKKRREEIPHQEPTRVSDTRKGFRDRIRGARRLIVILVLIGAVGGGVGYWWLNRGLVSTDDAFIDGDAVTLSPQVGGRIERLRISDNQRVKTGISCSRSIRATSWRPGQAHKPASTARLPPKQRPGQILN